MKVNEIEELVVRYYDGETNEAEEKELKEFFAQAERSGTFTCREETLHAARLTT